MTIADTTSASILVPSVEAIEPLEDRRTPTALVRVRIGKALAVVYTAQHRRRGNLILTPPEAATREAGVTVIDGRLERAIREAVTEALARDARARAALARYWSRVPDQLSGG